MNVLNKAEIHNIFQEIKNGNKEAIEELYAKYQKLVIKISFSIVKDDDAKANVEIYDTTKNPATGDNIILYIGLMFISMLVFSITATYKKHDR